MKLDLLRSPPDLPKTLWRLLGQVPWGRVTTYGHLAEALGDGAAARWVGQVMRHHDHTADCNCHRVVRSDGDVGGYVQDVAEKIRRLRAEGIVVRNERVDLEQYFSAVECRAAPLDELRRLQQSLARKIRLKAPGKMPSTIGAVDVSYGSVGHAVAAYALFECNRGGLSSEDALWTITRKRSATFPYITSYLSFREMPVLLDVLARAEAEHRLADVILVDGSGILHPRRAGIASMLGVAVGVATVGVTKTKLCGTVDLQDLRPGQLRPIHLDGQQLGWAVRPTTGSRKPLYVSPGHRTDVEFCKRLITVLLRGSKRRLLEPIHYVDRLSRKAATA